MTKNELYPIFLKVSKLNVLIVGGGSVALEKLSFLLKSSPNANVLLVAPAFQEQILTQCKSRNVSLIQDRYNSDYLQGQHVVIVATNQRSVNRTVYRDARKRNILVNVADTPTLCDFYLGGIVTKGQLKVAISTNGQSPTTAKRLRQFFEAVLPEELDGMVMNLHQLRKGIKGELQHKVHYLNRLTTALLPK